MKKCIFMTSSLPILGTDHHDRFSKFMLYALLSTKYFCKSTIMGDNIRSSFIIYNCLGKHKLKIKEKNKAYMSVRAVHTLTSDDPPEIGEKAQKRSNNVRIVLAIHSACSKNLKSITRMEDKYQPVLRVIVCSLSATWRCHFTIFSR